MECDENEYNYIEEVFCTPEIKEEHEVNTTSNILSLPEKSKHRYESMYEAFEKWKEENKILENLYSEEVLLWYIRDLSTKKSPSTLWCTYSMLKGIIKLKHNIDIGQYAQLIAFMKDQSKGYTAVTAPVFTDEEITRFINTAPDSVYLATKVALIFGIMGACKTDELTNMRVHHVETHGRIFLVKIPKPDQPSVTRSFTISDQYFDIVNKYKKMRPRNVKSDRFFLSYRTGKCTEQVIGRNRFGSMPREIANFLELENAHLYTGHSIRKTSSSLLANAGADRRTIKRHGTWKSTTEVQGYIDSSLHFKKKTETVVESSASQIMPNLYSEPEESHSAMKHTLINNAHSNNFESTLPDVATDPSPLPMITHTTSFKDQNNVILELPISMLHEDDNDDNQKSFYDNTNLIESAKNRRVDLIKKHFTFNNCSNVYINFK